MGPCPVRSLAVSAYRIPTETPESDGTFTWEATTLVVVEVSAGDARGLGYTYADRATALLIDDLLRPLVVGRSALDIRGTWDSLCRAVRNVGQPGHSRMAISALDTALWDLKARLLGVPLVSLFGAVRESMPLYGSGGFTNFSGEQMERQFAGWLEQGIGSVKMKIGRDSADDIRRVAYARRIIGPETGLFVDANGACSRQAALAQAERFQEHGVTWFEEPVSSDDLEGLRLLRDRSPAGLEIAAGEYAFTLDDFHRLLAAGAVDVLQADVTRCGGYTGFFHAAALCEAYHLPLSAHCAPALHLPLGCACGVFRHAEYFSDHARIERLLFEGAAEPRAGALHPDLSQPGHGLTFRHAAAQRFAV